MRLSQTSRRALLALFLAAALPQTMWIELDAQAQQPPAQAPLPIPKMAGTNIVFGTVVADATGRPVKGASVVVIVFSNAATFARNVKTDRQGRFLIGGLEATEIRLSASAPGYLGTIAGQNGADDTSGTNIPLEDGQPLGPLTLRLIKPGVITGTIVDEANEPMGGVAVQVFKRSFANGVRQFSAGETALTDDRGVYRITGLTPGTYVVGVVPRAVVVDTASFEQIAETGSATSEVMAAMAGVTLGAGANAASQMSSAIPALAGGDGLTLARILSSGSPVPIDGPDGRPRGYAPTFFPGLPPAAAQSIRVGAAEEKTADFQLTDVPLGTIAGHVVGPTGTPPPQAALSLVHLGDESVQIGDPLTALAGASGEFSFEDVPAGSYRIEARSAVRNAPGAGDAIQSVLWASVPITVNEKPQSAVVIALRDSLRVSGDVRFDGATTPPAGSTLTQWRVSITSTEPALPLQRMNLSVAGAALDADGRFSLGLMPGDYKLQLGTGLPGPWSLESVGADGAMSVDGLLRVGGDNIEHATIVMTDRPTMVSGAVSDADGKPVTNVTVIAFPRNPQLWLPNTRRIVSARPSSDGRYQIKSLPPGEYAVAVVRTVERGQWFDPEFLVGLQAGAEQVALGAGDKKTLDLKIR